MKTVIFVYGTLKQGFNNHYLLKDSDFIGVGKTTAEYSLYVPMVDEVVVGFPYMIKEESEDGVLGEMYVIDLKTRNQLDYLEGHPNFYNRITTQIRKVEDNKDIEAEVYIINKEQIPEYCEKKSVYKRKY